LELPADHRSASDESLAEAAKRGEVRALETLLDRHESKVLRVLGFLGIPGQDREDVAQEVFIRVFRHLGSYRRGLSFGGWLYRVTVNAAHDHRKRRARVERGEAVWEDGLEAEDGRTDPADDLRVVELRRALERALDQLSARERAVFVLKEIEGLDGAVVARTLGISTITVRRHLGRARRRLRKLLRVHDAVAPISVERIAPGGSSHG
jgi:RNA polymerase sigma-70 factor (ECF subfamily)